LVFGAWYLGDFYLTGNFQDINHLPVELTKPGSLTPLLQIFDKNVIELRKTMSVFFLWWATQPKKASHLP
jgi:hypothetical protein